MQLVFFLKIYHGFQSAGRGALIPSLAIYKRSGSFSGSMPMTRAYSYISERKYYSRKNEINYNNNNTIQNIKKLSYTNS